ncbi:MAG: dephospho-CoA kinase [Acidimicrobiales bacterium]
MATRPIVVIGLTGGIGSGKSTVDEALEARGAAVIEADRLARAALSVGSPGLGAVVERFGPGVLAPSGELDRAALAAVIFSDPEARVALELIVHPLVVETMARRVAAERAAAERDPEGDSAGEPCAAEGWGTGGPEAAGEGARNGPRVVVLDIPLLAESAVTLPVTDAVVVVDAPEEVALARLVARRGMDPGDVCRRMAAQASRQQRLALADHVIDNSGDLVHLEAEVDRAWTWMTSLP